MVKKIIYTPEQEAEMLKIEDKIQVLDDKIKAKLITKSEKELYKKLIKQLKSRLVEIKKGVEELPSSASINS